MIHGDGTSIWTLTHQKDFAKGFVGLLGEQQAINRAFHITSDEWLSWNTIYSLFAGEVGAEPEYVHVPSAVIAAYDREIGDSLLGDKSHSMIFDNSKIKSVVPGFKADIPFKQGVKEIVKWHEVDPSRRIVDERIDAVMDRIVDDYGKRVYR